MSLPHTDHFNGKTFFNPNHVDRSWRDVLRWRRTSHPIAWPRSVPLEPQPAAPAQFDNVFVATLIGHVTFLVRTRHGTILTDPHFSPRCGPFGLVGPRRVQPPALPLNALPSIDYIFLSHDHYDHCDLPSLRALARQHDPLVITPLANGPLVRRAGLRRVVELDWWQAYTPAPGLEVTLTPARHWSNRLSGRRNARLWGGFFARHDDRAWWFSGETGYDEYLFPEIRQQLGAPEMAMIPIGAYEPRWFMAAQHCNPAEAVQIHNDIGASVSLAMHWGTWQLTDEGRDDPVTALAAARTAASVPPEAFRVLKAGQSVII